eukprot:376209_1
MVFACFYVITTFNCTNMMNLARIMITACRQILLRSYLLQFGLFLWWNICVFAIKKQKNVFIHSCISYFGYSGISLDPQDNYITAASIIARVVYMDYLSYSEWLKFYYILVLIKEQNHNFPDKTARQNVLHIIFHVYYSKMFLNHVFFGYLYQQLSLHHRKSIYHCFQVKGIIVVIWDFIGIFTFPNVMKYIVLHCVKRGIDDTLHLCCKTTHKCLYEIDKL